MTDAEINAKIAELCNQDDAWLIVKRGLFYRPNGCGYTNNIAEAWKLPREQAEKHIYLRGDEPVTISRAPYTSYTTDLNACHEMEKTLHQYHGVLCAYQNELTRLQPFCGHDSVGSFLFHATARQRCEAFLKVKGVL